MEKKKVFYGWYNMVALWIICVVTMGFAVYSIGAVNTVMVEELGMSRGVLGAGPAVNGMLMGVLAPLVAWIINRYGIRAAMAIGSLFCLVGSVLMGTVVSTPFGFIAVYGIVMAFGSSAAGPLTTTTAGTIWFNRKRGLAIGFVLSSMGAGGFIAAPVFSQVIENYGGWRGAWFVLAGLSAIVMILSMVFVKNKPADIGQVPDGVVSEVEDQIEEKTSSTRIFQATRSWTLKEAIKTANYWLFAFATVGVFFSLMTVYAHSVAHFIDQGFPLEQAIMSVGLISLANIAGMLGAGYLADKYEPRYTFIGGMVLMIAAMIIAMHCKSTMSMYVFAVLSGLGIGCGMVIQANVCSNLWGPDHYASIMGTVSVLQTILAAIGPVLVGVIYDTQGSYYVGWIVTAAVCLASCICLTCIRPKELSVPEEEGYAACL